MSIQSLIAAAEAKVKSVEEQIASHTTGLASVTADIEKFVAGKANLLKNLDILSGAKQMAEALLADAKALIGDVATGNIVGGIEDAAKTATDVVGDVETIKSDIDAAKTAVGAS